MDTQIYYFSGTGNSLIIAKSLAKELPNSEVILISNVINNKSITSDASKIIFVFPVYYCGLPLIIEKFIIKLHIPASTKIIFINTSGDDNGMDCSSYKISKILKSKSNVLTGGYNIQMPGNYTKMYDMESKESISNKISTSNLRIKQIASMILLETNSIKKDNFRFIGNLVNNYWQKRVSGSDKSYNVSQECNGCGICEKMCPVNNIVLIDNKPKWQHNCEDCIACLHYCPKNAINTKKSIGRQQYHHPLISANELILIKKNNHVVID